MITWKRGSIEIIGEILQSLRKSPQKKSHIANNCNLDARSVNKYLEIIINLDFAKISKDMKHFTITQKGINFLEMFYTLTKFFETDLQQSKEIKDSNLNKPKIRNYSKNKMTSDK